MKTDIQIQQDVLEELKWTPHVAVNEIGVTVKNRIVTLSGTVDAYWKKAVAENASGRVSGVRAVAEDIAVKLPSDRKTTDAELAEMVLKALKWQSSVPDEELNIKVEDGWVTLEGKVEWDYQRKSVNSALANVAGVKGISNNIQLSDKATPEDIQHKINEAFIRHAQLDSDKINVAVTWDKVTLTGHVSSYAEREYAEAVAWRAEGITRVDNRIEVDSPL